ncbi:uncharacterized protein PAC_06820 [Phialocephala subalpina]|uniref:6-methylsalicylate decarboxylase n=1 Tax=Phialocephala subalpina TaxID=576137 RepID=A0A1L7WVW3_9HELO|nr:uncharacterized protein PAC_06820 [Phialocephala subalpina]
MDSCKLPERIDVHCHAVPEKYREKLIKNGFQNPDGMPAIPPWDAEIHLQLMKDRNISRSILSITSPGTNLTPNNAAEATTTTRQTNEELSSICRSHPEHFSFFASLPLPLVSESIQEIDYTLDTLGAVGFTIISNAHGLYLGDPTFTPVLEKLNSRKATIFIHPTTCNLIIPESHPFVKPVTVLPYPRPMMEFMFDETRVVANILLSGLLDTYPDLTFIMSHCGCTLPPIIDRIGAFDAILCGREDSSQRFKDLLKRRFYFDLAGKPFPEQIHGLVRMLGGAGEASSRLVYGSDFPFTREKAVIGLQDLMEGGLEEIFGKEVMGDIYVGNARKLLNL